MDPTDATVNQIAETAEGAIARLRSLAYQLRYERDNARVLARGLAQCIESGTEPPRSAFGASYVQMALALPDPTEEQSERAAQLERKTGG